MSRSARQDARMRDDLMGSWQQMSKIRDHFAHEPEELRLKRLELNQAETRVHNFIEFIASGRATPALADALAQAEEQVKSLTSDVTALEAAKAIGSRRRRAPGSRIGSAS